MLFQKKHANYCLSYIISKQLLVSQENFCAYYKSLQQTTTT